MIKEIEEAYEEIFKEYNEYKNAKIEEFKAQGTVVDIASHDAHWVKVFMLAKLQMLSTGGKKSGKAKTGRKESTGTETPADSDGRQLKLGL